ncbi:cardiolipin synthase (CMP-forming) isoform X1 [Ixodes scapularis]
MALRLALRRVQFHKIYGHREFLGLSSLLGPGWDAFEVTLGCARVACVSTSTRSSSKNLEEPARPLPFVRSRARIAATRDSLIRTRDSLRATRGRVSADVRQTKRIVSERIGNLLDGWVARAFPSQQSNLGTLVDPLADKCLVATLFLSLTVAGLIPVPLTALILARDGIILGCAGYLRFVSLPSPRTLARYFDVTLATVKFTPTTISKANTAIQLGLVAATLAAPVFSFVDHPALQAFWFLTAFTTTTSGLMYIFSKDSYKFVKAKA